MIELLKRLIAYSIRHVPTLRKKFWTQYYDFVAQTIDDDDFVYMNLGYANLDGKEDATSLEKTDRLNHFSDQLYQHVAGAVDLRGQEVLEIGCGRGGGSLYVIQHLKPKTLTAVDLSHVALEYCQRRYNLSGLSFKEVDAESLPFADSSFDTVICIESAHCYSSKVRFLAEVTRVLRPKGYFLYADILNPLFEKTPIQKSHELLNHCGLNLLKAENISANVLRSRGILSESPSYRKCIARWTQSRGKRNKLMSSIFCLKGTLSYERLRTGKMQYWCWVMQKPGSFLPEV